MTWKLFIDDERFPASEGWVIARSSEEAIQKCREYGFPSFISFDHDLGGDDTSIVFINWMIEQTLDSITSGPPHYFPRDYFIHSQNPVGRDNIKSLMDSFIAYYYNEN